MIPLIAFLCGLIFSIGLGLSGMTLPTKVLGFLNLTGQWDPTLAFVMAGAIAVTGLLFPRILRRQHPALEAQFDLPTRTRIEPRLLIGAALFGVGWGLTGYCPGPALVSLTTGAMPITIFVATMFIGFYLGQR